MAARYDKRYRGIEETKRREDQSGNEEQRISIVIIIDYTRQNKVPLYSKRPN